MHVWDAEKWHFIGDTVLAKVGHIEQLDHTSLIYDRQLWKMTTHQKVPQNTLCCWLLLEQAYGYILLLLSIQR